MLSFIEIDRSTRTFRDSSARIKERTFVLYKVAELKAKLPPAFIYYHSSDSAGAIKTWKNIWRDTIAYGDWDHLEEPSLDRIPWASDRDRFEWYFITTPLTPDFNVAGEISL